MHSGPEIASFPPQPASATTRARPVGFAIAAAIFVIALALDVPISNWAHNSGLAPAMKNATGAAHYFIHYGLRFYGQIGFCLAACFVLWLQGRHQIGLVVLLSGIFSSSNQFFKWCFGRFRPFHNMPPFALHPFIGGIPGFIHAEVSLGFPSGDATLAFAMTASLTWAWPRRQKLWWALGIWTCLERIAEGAHYPSDTVAGACLGLFVASVARQIVKLFAKVPPA
ncbi:MAG: phosphatase PAP2 family protein [Tepidisphaeraceae bacterium]